MKQSRAAQDALDCFAALAMTKQVMVNLEVDLFIMGRRRDHFHALGQ